jgi:hypothetical protein
MKYLLFVAIFVAVFIPVRRLLRKIFFKGDDKNVD